MHKNDTPKPIWTKFCMVVGIRDVITYTNYGDLHLWVFLVAGDQISPFPKNLSSSALQHCCTTVQVCEP